MEQKTIKPKVEIALPVKHRNIYEALSAFQGELKPMAKTGHVEFPTRTGTTMKFDYTPLGEIMATIYPLLSRHGLSVRHEVLKNEDGKTGVVAVVTHETYEEYDQKVGEELEKKDNSLGIVHTKYSKTGRNFITSGFVPVSMVGEMKDTGAAITYARRYTLTMVLGISSEEDKDVSLLEQSGKNAAQFAYNKVREGLDKAKTEAELKKATDMLEKELKTVESGKAGALGLTKENYEELLEYGTFCAVRLADAKKGE